MKHHVVVRLHRRITEPPVIPDWITFITDKTHQVSSVDGGVRDGVDDVLHRAGREFFVTHEYTPAEDGEDGWAALEVHHGLDRVYRLVTDDQSRLGEDVMAALVAAPAVESAHQLHVTATPIPVSRRPVESGMATALSRSPHHELLGVDFAHALTRGHADVRMAVLDTGVNLTHPELAGKIVGGADFVDLEGLDTGQFVGDFLGRDEIAEDELGHGTHVAGIMAAEGRAMPRGVAPDCRLLAVRVLATLRTDDHVQGAGIVDNINPAIKWAVDQGADVINMSLGIRHTGGGLPHAEVIRYALARGVTVVAASGNDGTDTKYYPGALPGVVAVGAVDESGRAATFTSYGAPITVIAPGVNVLSSFARGQYAVASGTSQAAPYVAGAAALLHSLAREHGRRLDASDIATILRETSDRPDRRHRTPHHGYGRLNLTDACKWLLHSLN